MLALVMGLAVVLVAACGSAPTPTAPPERTHITVTSLPVVDLAPLYLAQQAGYFRDAGLDVTIQPLAASTQAFSGLADGTVDIVAGGNYVSFLQAQDQGKADLRLVSEAVLTAPGYCGLLAGPRSGITDVRELAGRTVAVNLVPNIQTLALDRVLASRGVDPRSVRYVGMPFPQIGAALRDGRVDAATLVEPYVTADERDSGSAPLLDPCSGPTDKWPLSGYWTSSRYAAQFPNTVHAFRDAIARGAALAADAQRTTAILPSYAQVDPPTASLISLPTYPTTVAPERVQRVADLMAQSGLIRPLDVASLVAR